MLNRRKFLHATALSSLAGILPLRLFSQRSEQLPAKSLPIVISTWDAGINANKGAWKVLSKGGRALDAVEQGVMVTEEEILCCVGLGAYPDRDGIVSLDACIMDEHFNCGGVAFLERIKHPVSVARRVMEKTPHVLLAGEGAQQFAVAEGFPLEPQELSESAKKAYQKWLEKSEYKPQVNIERTVPGKLDDGKWNHDTIGMVAIDVQGNMSGSCTTSGMAFKMHGRVGDSPLIGAGLYVDNEVGSCTATGQGEEVIRMAGSAMVVEFMRDGLSPQKACEKAIRRIVGMRKEKSRDFQVAFLALGKDGRIGAYALQEGFNYAVTTSEGTHLVDALSYYP